MKVLFLSPRGSWILFALLLAGTTRSASQNAEATSMADVHEVEDPSVAGAGAPNETVLSLLLSRCDSYRYYDPDESFGYYSDRGNSEYARLNDLTSSCKSRATNARGKYTSKDLCYFAFHAIPGDAVTTNRLSEACSDDNLVEESRRVKDDPLAHSVRNWPDTCVGDFPRCYSLEHDQAVFLNFLCAKKLKVPDGATHLRVDCTADKANLKKMLENGELEDTYADTYLRHQQKERIAYFQFVMGLVMVACGCCFGFFVLVHKYAVKPYIQALKRTRSNPELANLTASSTDPSSA